MMRRQRKTLLCALLLLGCVLTVAAFNEKEEAPILEYALIGSSSLMAVMSKTRR
jgi:hypothetical protein